MVRQGDYPPRLRLLESVLPLRLRDRRVGRACCACIVQDDDAAFSCPSEVEIIRTVYELYFPEDMGWTGGKSGMKRP